MKSILIFLFILVASLYANENVILIEAESFTDKGQWVVDQQFIEIMGSSYLLAHGLGKPVMNASTNVSFSNSGSYHLWVRTKDWAPYPVGPGKFKIYINAAESDSLFGSNGLAEWQWYYGGQVEVKSGDNLVSIKDLTGFDARVDAILFTDSDNYRPPDELKSLDKLRRAYLDLPEIAPDAGVYDLVVVGGGIAGICAALSASRQGLRVALIQNRPKLGGNNSSEVRVHLMGGVYQKPYPKLGRIVKELDNGDPGNASHLPGAYGDSRKLAIVKAEKNISLYLNMHAYNVEMDGDNIIAVIARHIEKNSELRFSGKYFADCTGDGTIGFLAGADFRMGREGKDETGESLASSKADEFTLGSSNLWYASEKKDESEFPECPWALQFSSEYHLNQTKADWRWETGFGHFNIIEDAEKIRDHNLRAIFGNWSFLKNQYKVKYANWELDWVAFIAGKRESRRLLGDLVLTEQDIINHHIYPDGCVTATWTIDLHFPDQDNVKHYPGEAFYSATKHIKIEPYPIPYRCFYSRNIRNLFMAGRNISTTHVAFGATRVMRTTGMMGEVVGMAAFLCCKFKASPREIYEVYLNELIELLSD